MRGHSIVKNCEVCGKEMVVWPSNLKAGRGRFCSVACKSRHQESAVVRNCGICGKEFDAYLSKIKIGQGRFCSPACYHRSHAIPLIDRFFEFVGEKTSSGCILWTGANNRHGYGKIWNEKSILTAAHRVSYELFVGSIPDGLWVLHSCDNPPCINPVHLFLGTHADNMKDMVKKGRSAKGTVKGEQCGRAKLTESQVREIRVRHANGDGKKAIAADYGIGRLNVSMIVRGKTWKHVV